MLFPGSLLELLLLSSSCQPYLSSSRPIILLPWCFPIWPFPPWSRLKSHIHDLFVSATFGMPVFFSLNLIPGAPFLFNLLFIYNWGRRWSTQSSAGTFACIHSPPAPGYLVEGTKWRSRRKLINQPNENILTDTETSYSHIKGLGGRQKGR